MNKSPIESTAAAVEKSKPALPSALQRQLERHFTTCTVTVGSAVALAAAVPAAKGSIIVYDADVTVAPNDHAGTYFDFQTGAVTTAATSGSDVNLIDYVRYNSTVGAYVRYQNFYGYNNGTTLIQGNGLVQNLALNAPIGPGGTFSPPKAGFSYTLAYQVVSSSAGRNALAPRGGTFLSGTGFMGVSFSNTAGATDYGYLQVSVDATSGDLTVLDFAYDDSGAAILAGAVPEPGSCALGCLAVGAVGLGVWRHRRQARQAAAPVPDAPAA